MHKLNYDPIKSFTPISIFATGPNVLAINPTLPVNSVKELVALAKQKPGELNYASAGVGSFQHLGGELFKLTAGVNIVHVPYKGGGPAMRCLISALPARPAPVLSVSRRCGASSHLPLPPESSWAR